MPTLRRFKGFASPVELFPDESHLHCKASSVLMHVNKIAIAFG
jgi:hypothetical protein